MLLNFVLAVATAGSPETTVRTYLDALSRLDHDGMLAVMDEGCTAQLLSEPPEKIDRETMRRYRDYERGVDTKWSYEVLGVHGGEVTVLSRETNAFYDLIGVGTRSIVEIYTVANGLVRARRTLLSVQAQGDYQAALDAFKAWMARQPGATAPGLFDGRYLTFDGQSAPRMLPWLRKYAAERG